jgi:sugar/nucleoside kinase (ribokinase family)
VILERKAVCRFIGSVADDELGRSYNAALQQHGVRPCLVQPPATCSEPSAVAYCLITPDGQRTMRTCLGAAAHLSTDTLPLECLQGCALLHCEGYMFFKPVLLKAAIAAAKAAGAQVSIDLASFEVVRHCQATLWDVLASGFVDIVFCNEDEIAELDKLAQQQGAGAEALLLRHCSLAIVTLGSGGARATATGGASLRVSASEVTVVDSVGAGDFFCGAFLSAYLAGASLRACAEAGCAAGAQVVQCHGAHLEDNTWETLRRGVRDVLERDREN